MFGFAKKCTWVAYVSKGNKIIILISSRHESSLQKNQCGVSIETFFFKTTDTKKNPTKQQWLWKLRRVVFHSNIR